MRALGIVGAAAAPRPGSGALRTPASSIFPSRWSEGGDSESNSLAGLSMVAAKGPRSVGGENLATGGGRGRTAPFVVLDCAEGHPRLGRNKPRASQGHPLTQPGALALPILSSSEAQRLLAARSGIAAGETLLP